MEQIIAVIPRDDTRSHNTGGEDCFCNPIVEKIDGGVLVIHNAFDNREIQEIAALRAENQRLRLSLNTIRRLGTEYDDAKHTIYKMQVCACAALAGEEN